MIGNYILTGATQQIKNKRISPILYQPEAFGEQNGIQHFSSQSLSVHIEPTWVVTGEHLASDLPDVKNHAQMKRSHS